MLSQILCNFARQSSERIEKFRLVSVVNVEMLEHLFCPDLNLGP